MNFLQTFHEAFSLPPIIASRYPLDLHLQHFCSHLGSTFLGSSSSSSLVLYRRPQVLHYSSSSSKFRCLLVRRAQIFMLRFRCLLVLRAEISVLVHVVLSSSLLRLTPSRPTTARIGGGGRRGGAGLKSDHKSDIDVRH
ncbi:hypothetical protein V2J09_003249 [Rumex salicifolius]